MNLNLRLFDILARKKQQNNVVENFIFSQFLPVFTVIYNNLDVNILRYILLPLNCMLVKSQLLFPCALLRLSLSRH